MAALFAFEIIVDDVAERGKTQLDGRFRLVGSVEDVVLGAA